MRRILTFAFFALTAFVQSQNYTAAELVQLEDEVLLAYYNSVFPDSLQAEQVARVYLERARMEADTVKMARGYDRLARIFHPEKNILFADTLIELTSSIENNTYPALGYILKSYEYHIMNNLVVSSEYAYKAYKLATAKSNIVQILYISDRLIYNKSVWGNKKEALKLQKLRHALMQDKNFYTQLREASREELRGDLHNVYLDKKISSIQNFIFCHLNLRNLDSAKLFLKEGLMLNDNYQGQYKDYYNSWFKEVAVEIDYYNGEFAKAIVKSDRLLTSKIDKLSKLTVFNLNIFKGFSYLKLHRQADGIRCLKIADSSYDANHFYLQPYQRELFEKLLHYHKAAGDTAGQLVYLNKLMRNDSVFKVNYQYFEPKMIKHFETPKLLLQKTGLIEKLESRHKRSQYLIAVGLFGFVLMLFYLFHSIKKKLRYKRRFLLLIAKNNGSMGPHEKPKREKTKIGGNIIDEILSKLDQFERKKAFLSNSVSLQKLANKFKTNTKYLSNVINIEKQKSFRQYVNDLRVEFALKEITINARFRKYTIKAIAGDCGFNSAESFSKAFDKKHGVSPSYFIKKIEKLK